MTALAFPLHVDPGMLRRWSRLCCCGWLLGSGLAAGADAWADDVRPAGPELALAMPASPGRSAQQRALDLQWRNGHAAVPTARDGRWQFTLQRYERPWQPGFAPQPDAVAVAVYVNAGARTQFGWQSRPFGVEDNRVPWQDGSVARPAGAMTLRSADPLSDLRLGALAKYSFGPQTSLSLRPRKGGLRLYLQSQW
jgi:hypothetical protein